MTALVTAIYDGYDTLKEFHDQSIPVDAVCVTDDPDLQSWCWRVVYDPRPDEHPNRAAKRAKMCPWLYTEAKRSVWIDASFRVTSPTFMEDVLPYADPIAQFVHPWRDDLYEEAVASRELVKYEREPIAPQVERYREWGVPEHWGLWSCGVIVRQHTAEMRAFGNRWLDECRQWSYQDQVSEPAMLHEQGMRPTQLPGGIWNNEWLTYEPSGRHG